LACHVEPDQAAAFVITREYGDPDREMMAAALNLAVVGRIELSSGGAVFWKWT
jgi:hypothetical protein